jgi:hypothetical protein
MVILTTDCVRPCVCVWGGGHSHVIMTRLNCETIGSTHQLDTSQEPKQAYLKNLNKITSFVLISLT